MFFCKVNADPYAKIKSISIAPKKQVIYGPH